MAMLDQIVSHSDIATFANEKVNLKNEDVIEYRNQVSNLRTKLEKYIKDNPSFDIVKMLHSGSMAKGTALKTINDIDVAMYLKAGAVPEDETILLDWTADRIKEVYGNTIKPGQISIAHHCVTVSFVGTGLDVDIVPIIYEGDPDDRGYLIPPTTGERVLTSIPLHLKFLRKRKNEYGPSFSQMIRLIKWWSRTQKANREGFRFKSFMVELLFAWLYEQGFAGNDYAEGLFQFFSYIVNTQLSERIVFADYYKVSEAKVDSSPIQIFDPVNPENNVTNQYTQSDLNIILDAAEDACDAIAYARRASTKGEAVSAWQDILGTGFKG
jgi:tRNA nucleotidyltransferase (CCA-adding enzyme)